MGLVVSRSGRAGDRRRGLHAMIGAIAAAAPFAREPRLLRQRFEEELRTQLRARSIELRDSCSLAPPHPDTTWSLDVIAGSSILGSIDMVLEEGSRLDDWDRQVLDAAQQVAALVLLFERAVGITGFSAHGRSDGAAPLIGSSAAIANVRERIARVAGTDFTVLIEGESGTGKELVARQIHDLSPRRRGPFIAVNCAAIVETLLEAELFGIEERTATGVRGRRGKFEHAQEGTLFLDEVADLSPAAQAKLLRAIQDMTIERVGGAGPRRVNTRIIVATNQRLVDLVGGGRFRLDLFYRLSGVEVAVPPLRDRREDILELATYFLERHRAVRQLRLSQAAAGALIAYHWPGNVRELERVMERAVALADSDELQLDDLPPALLSRYDEVLRPSVDKRETMRAWGSRYARIVLERCGNNKRRACEELGITYHTLNAYLRYPVERRRPRRVIAGVVCRT
ncbi:MAG TPA: sigma 54-interacting transcriptional regulator [Vicinamibacterales bacterium]|nr:sigma 54-interacting transcriptional regulator [Vicinamibacterales bacterium]